MDKNNKNEETIVLKIGVDYRDPNQRDPYKPKPDYSGYDALASLGSLAAQQSAAGQLFNQGQQGQFGQAPRGWPFGGLF